MCRLDPARWAALCRRLGVAEHALRYETLCQAYGDSRRHYHTDQHIVDCLTVLDAAIGLASQADALEFALWLHDVVYDPLRRDNEERSAELALEWLPDGDPDLPDRVRGLIQATRHTEPPSDPDEALIQDVDLHILGADPERFDRYEAEVRLEYGRVPEPLFRKARREVIASFLRREYLYHTTWFRSRYEAQAKENLQRSIERL